MTTKTFSDIDLSFQEHPTTGDLVAKYDENAIKNSLRNLILTKHFERPFRSAIGSNINSLLFELEGPALTALLEKEIVNVIENFEPRVDVLQVDVENAAETNSLNATIYFKIKNTFKPIQLDLILRRTR
jgi:phage baseplate assembly protein W